MACGCSGGGTFSYRYELAQEDGRTEEFDTLEPARIRQAEIGGVVRTLRIQVPLGA